MKNILFVLIITIFFFACNKKNNDDRNNTPNPVTSNYRILKIIGPVNNQDSLVFNYFSNKLVSIIQYYYLDGSHRNIKYEFSYNSDNNLSRITYRGYGFNNIDTTYFEYNNNILSKIINRSSNETNMYDITRTEIIENITTSNSQIAQIQNFYRSYHTWYVYPTIYEDSTIYSLLELYSYNSNNPITRTIRNQTTGIEKVINYEYDSKTNPFKTMGLMPSFNYCLSFTPLDYYLDELAGLSVNNLTKLTASDGNIITYQYEYNSDGLPTKALKNGKDVMTFIYEKIN